MASRPTESLCSLASHGPRAVGSAPGAIAAARARLSSEVILPSLADYRSFLAYPFAASTMRTSWAAKANLSLQLMCQTDASRHFVVASVLARRISLVL